MQRMNQTIIQPTNISSRRTTPVVITGGAGFIGSHVIKALNNNGTKDIIIVDSLGTGDKWKNLRGLKFADIVNPIHFADWAEDSDLNAFSHIIHLGANTNTKDPDNDEVLMANFSVSQAIHDISRMKNMRMIYASSCNVYGDGEDGFRDDVPVINYTHKPLSVYGYSKQLFDQYLFSGREDDQDTSSPIGLRIFNTYGNGESHKGDMRSLMGKMILQLKNKETVEIIDSQRDFTYVKDVAEIIVRFYNSKDILGGIYNVGTGIATDCMEAAKKVSRVINNTEDFDFVNIDAKEAGRYQLKTQAKTDKLLSTIGNFNFKTIEEATKDMLDEGIS